MFQLYKGLYGAVAWKDRLSRWFPVQQGVRQGGILSPLLYLVYIDGLIQQLRKSGAGCRVLCRYTGTLVLADDVVLIANRAEELQSMLQTVYKYTKQWHYDINPTKSAVVICNPGKRTANTQWNFGPNTIPVQTSHPHLGILRSSARSDHTHQIFQTGNRSLYSLTGTGAYRRGLSPVIISSMWKTFCVPRMLYGVEALNLTEREKKALDKMQIQLLRTLLGLPRSAPLEAVPLLTGLPSMLDTINLLHLRLLGKILSLPSHRIEHRLFTSAVCLEPTIRTVRVMKAILLRYDLPPLPDLIQQAYPYATWKKLATEAVERKALSSLSNEASRKSSLLLFHHTDLSLLSNVFPSIIHPAHLRLAINIKAQLLTGTYLTMARLLKISKLTSDPSCPACHASEESVSHLVSECKAYAVERENLLEHFPNNALVALKEVTGTGPHVAKTKLILLGIVDNVSYQFPDFHSITLQFLLDIHYVRQRIVDQTTAHHHQ